LVSQPSTGTMNANDTSSATQYAGFRKMPVRSTASSSTITAAAAASEAAG
jgi:hypothetical protein